mmetsp:Transcript_81577/g.214155  ORF Transcript_81577/g.214155 Transcript_81577/m.214155 type:complete len:197 (+) Transcript_81577:88-678(+)
MARGPATYTEGAVDKATFLSASWPAAVPRKHAPQPPRSPPLRPCRALWEVPPLELPPGGPWWHRRTSKISQRSGSASVDTAATSWEAQTWYAASEEEEEDESEECIFAFHGSGAASPAEENDEAEAFHMKLVGLDDEETYADTDVSGVPLCLGSYLGSKYFNEALSDQWEPPTVASPVLLSALEQLAAGAGLKWDF